TERQDAANVPSCRSRMRAGMSRLATAAFALLLAACTNASGTMFYESTDPFGALSGSVSSGNCRAQVDSPAPAPDISIPLTIHHSPQMGAVHLSAQAGGQTVSVTAQGTGWTVSPEMCSTYDVKKWWDDKKRLHVTIRLDCRTPKGAHIHGTVESDDCLVT